MPVTRSRYSRGATRFSDGGGARAGSWEARGSQARAALAAAVAAEQRMARVAAAPAAQQSRAALAVSRAALEQRVVGGAGRGRRGGGTRSCYQAFQWDLGW
jgi:hypothetical protein